MKKQLQKGFTLIELMIVVAIIGILASIALPAYQDYISRGQATEAPMLLAGLKTPVTENILNNGVTAGCVIPADAVTAGKYVATIGATVAGTTCELLATYQAAGVSDKIASKNVQYTYDHADGSWECTSNLPAAIKPKGC